MLIFTGAHHQSNLWFGFGILGSLSKLLRGCFGIRVTVGIRIGVSVRVGILLLRAIFVDIHLVIGFDLESHQILNKSWLVTTRLVTHLSVLGHGMALLVLVLFLHGLAFRLDKIELQ